MARVCLIGCNDNAVKYADLLNRLNALACVYDENPDNAAVFAKRYNLSQSYYTSIQDVVNDTSIDGIVIATDASKHLALIKEIVDCIRRDDKRSKGREERGRGGGRSSIHILVDEPFTDDYNKCKEIAAIIDSSKGRVNLMPCYIEYFNPIIEDVKHIITSKGYEPILLAFDSITYEEERLDPRIIMHNDITTLVYLIKELPRYVSSISISKNRDELIASLLAYTKSKLIVEIVTRIVNVKRKVMVREDDNYARDNARFHIHRRLKIVCTDDTILEINPLEQELIIHNNNNDKIVRKEHLNKLHLLVSNFIAAIDGREKLKVTIDDALLVERIKDAIVLSSRLGSPIYIGDKL
jgi:UDP-N-acetylglucosamine 3-dehydrogenase